MWTKFSKFPCIKYNWKNRSKQTNKENIEQVIKNGLRIILFFSIKNLKTKYKAKYFK